MKKILTIIGLLALLGCGEDAEKTYTVTYELKCVLCDITLNNNQGNTEQYADVAGSEEEWAVVYEMKKVPKGFFTYISAQNQNGNGSVSVRVRAGSKTISESSSTGAYVIATASESVPE